MSRIGKKPIPVPAGVQVAIEGNLVTVQGPKGKLSRELHKDITVTVEDNTVLVTRPSDEKNHRALHGLTRTLVANMVEGVTQGFSKKLELVGVGYRAAKQGKKLVLTVGYSHPVEFELEEGLDFEVPAPTKITILGIDKEKVGALAANIRKVREPEPYKGKGIKYENEVIRRKVGKTGGKKGGKK
ncbi:50S ribosomal protein L6 [Heliophilum fasciatum]|uniref:Large ribosomal subunit protein uL6 n=1 Tax=Heliophilum fasciatum TaxID=35700 RepID=A0A4R2S046_9FIRM|nr:50S ribosomal protein L6 [Heliophilum fasciatum]MCW2277801.1 large subunit ribosomal protein L6 [Heliophilum fasciatum]TCP64705.1 large subunit ribosomal protein L6 [Heliophilum fasciatum]